MLSQPIQTVLQQDLDKKTVLSISAAAAITVTVSAIIRHYCTYRRSVTDKAPIVSYKFPIIGSTLDYYKDTARFCKETAEKHGPVFQMHFQGELVKVVGAGYADQIFTNPNMSFVTSAKKFIDLEPLASAYKKTKARLPETAFFDIIRNDINTNLKFYTPQVYRQSLILADELFGNLDGPREFPDLHALSRKFVARATGTTLLGPDLVNSNNTELLNSFENAAEDGLKTMLPGPLRVLFPWYNNLYKRFMFPRYRCLKRHIQIIRRHIEPKVREEYALLHSNKERDLTKRDVMQHVIHKYMSTFDVDSACDCLTGWMLGMMFVAILTTSASLTGMLIFLARYPEYIPELLQEQQEALKAEGFAGLKECDQIMTPAVLKHLVKLDSFIREVLRYSSHEITHPHKHVGKEDIILSNGVVIRPGEEVYINLWHVHHDPATQDGMDDLTTFQPFRFVGHDKQVTKAGKDYLAFGMGRHACPGRWFAIHEIKVMLSILIRRYKISLVDSESASKSLSGIRVRIEPHLDYMRSE